MDIEGNSFLDKASAWLDNVSLHNLDNQLQKLIRSSDSTHTDNIRIRLDPQAGDLRGSIEFDGKVMYTASPSVLTYDITLPDASVLDLPFSFIENNVGANIEISFNGNVVYSASGDDFILNEMTTLPINIDAFQGQAGQLSIVLNTNGSDSAKAFGSW